MTALKCDTKRVLSITFPELERTMGIFTRTTLRLLCRFPSTHAAAQADHDELARLLQNESRGRNTPASADTLLNVAQSSVGTANGWAENLYDEKE
jgi:hypothetical protein